MEVLGVSVKAYFVQYRFIFSDNIKHSSYTYQKIFRAIYGYTQAVYKSNGKKYNYYRDGILSNTPYIRPGKNCVIIPTTHFQKLQDFFKTGKNPAHNWFIKGDWKCTYFINEKDVSEKDIVVAIKDFISKKYFEYNGERFKLSVALEKFNNQNIDQNQKNLLISQVQNIIDNIWFRESYSQSEELTVFYNNFKKLRNI